MNYFVHRMLGHYLQNEAEEGAELPGGEEAEQEQETDEPGDEPQEEEGEQQLVITLGDQQKDEQEQEAKAAPQWVKDLRKRVREQEREIREYKAKEQQASQAKLPEIGKKPSLSDDDIDYDEEKFEAKLSAWHERKRQVDAAAAEQRQAEEKANEEWQAQLGSYAEQKSALKLADYEDYESVVADTLNQNQQAIIIKGVDKSAHLIYALGKNPAKLKELAAITDPLKFAFAVARLETQMKVENKPKSKPSPERSVTGSAPATGNSDANLDRLRAEAEKTGDYSKVTAYKKQLREKKRA